MCRLIAVTSGKGGVGKSNVSVRLAEALSAYGEKVLLIDLDAGMRCLDLLLGVSDSLVFDLNDLLEEGKALSDIILPTKNEHINLIAAPLSEGIDTQKLSAFLKDTQFEYDFIILDFPAGGVGELYKALPKYTEALVVCNADAVSVRDASLIGKSLKKLELISVRLILNRADSGFMKLGVNANIDQVIDSCGLRLIAVIPQSMDVYYAACKGEQLKKKSKAAKAFARLAKRILGFDIPFESKKL